LRLHLACVGKLKTGPEKAMCEDYALRIQHSGKTAGIRSLSVTERGESQRATAAERMAEEATALLGSVPDGATLVVLDERGQSMTSPQFAKLVESRLSAGTTDLAFVIGGPDGLSQTIREKSKHIIALGGMTWPHRLVRVMVLEQIYRAVTIMVNHPYHRA
jgi:23S rRNA (pseudouridine1915-N3)-methyltransferase